MKYKLRILLIVLAIGALAHGQTNPPAAPRLASGKINLGTAGGETGVWVPPNAGDERLVELDSSMAATANPFAIETNPLQRTPRPAGVTSATTTGGSCFANTNFYANLRNPDVMSFILGAVPNATRQ